MVISGAPDETEYHPVHICELALDFIDVAKSLTDPTTNQPIQLRIGGQNLLRLQLKFVIIGL